MMRCLIFLFTVFFSISVWAFSWADLWYTPNQQGQQLMDKEEFLKAKEMFEQRDWAASAAYKAGDYEQAARLFKELDTGQGYYNQGNALAQMGQYEHAIKAYDKALELDPKNEDAHYNRKLVQDLLKNNKDKQDSQDQQNQDQQNQDQQNQDQQNQDQQNQDQQNQDQQNQDQQNQDQQNQDQQNQEQQNQDQQNQDQQNQDQQNQDQQNQQDENKINKNQQKQESGQKEKENKQEKDNLQSEADQEKQQAKQQWLRLIPDDPGGLMREKFLRDHLRRERGWYQ